MEHIENIYDLLPEEIEKLINKIIEALNIVKDRKNTNSRFVDSEKTLILCPKCNSEHIIKNGHDKNKIQTYKCKDCKKKFNACTNTLVSHVKLTYEQLLIFFECMDNKLSIRKTAAKMNVNKNTVFLLRHKVLDCISIIRENIKLRGTAEGDETYESINLKGTKKENMPRFSKPRSSDNGNSKRGINDHQVCIASVIDEYDNFFLEIVGTGPITSLEVEKAFYNRLNDVTCLITDCKTSYEKFAKDNSIRLEQVKSGTYKNINGYSLGNINSLHSEWATFVSSFRGVSTKHLQHYLDWFSFQKIINYTTETLKRPLTMMKKASVNKCNINSDNVYDNSSGINFTEVYAEYNYSPLTN